MALNTVGRLDHLAGQFTPLGLRKAAHDLGVCDQAVSLRIKDLTALGLHEEAGRLTRSIESLATTSGVLVRLAAAMEDGQ